MKQHLDQGRADSAALRRVSVGGFVRKLAVSCDPKAGRLALWAGFIAAVTMATVVEVRGTSSNSAGEIGAIAGDKAQPVSPPNSQTCPPNNASNALKSPDDARNKKATGNPIDLRNGFVIENATDVSLPGLASGTGYAQSRNYSSGFRNATGVQPRYLLGDRWMTGQADMILNELGNSDIELYVDATSKRLFTNRTQVGTPPNHEYHYDASNDLNLTLIQSDIGTVDELFTLTNLDTGQVLVFSGLDSSVTAGTRGRLKEQTTRELMADSQPGLTFTYNASGVVSTVTTSQGWSIIYTHVGGGSAVAGRIRNIKVWDGVSDKTPDDTNAIVVREVEYTYYDDVTTPSADIGSSGDLVQVRTRRRDTATTAWVTRYTQYRYFTNSSNDGSDHQLKCVIEPDAIQRILDSGDTDVETVDEIMQAGDATDVSGNSLSDYFSRSFTYYTSDLDTESAYDTIWPGADENFKTDYNGDNVDEYEVSEAGMARTETIHGDCSSCGGGSGAGIRKEYYYLNLHGGPDSATDVDQVARLIIEDTVADSDGDGAVDDPQYRMIYGVNKDGRLLRQATIGNPSIAGNDGVWCTSTVMGTSGNGTNRITEVRMPSAHASVNTNSELQDFLDPTVGSNDANSVENTAGVIYSYEYNADGRRTATLVQEGENGTAYYTSYVEYGDGVVADEPKHLPIETRVYPTAVSANPETNGIATTYAYDFWDAGDTVIQKRTVTLPSIATSQNGSGISATTEQYYDELGRLRWTKDGEGYCNYFSYHPDTGGLAYTVRDVDPTSLPSSADHNDNESKWLDSTDDGGATYKPTRGGSLPTAIAMVAYSEFDNQGRTVKRVTETPSTADEDDVTHIVYESTRTLTFPQWDSGTNKPLLPIRVTEVDDAGVMQKSYAVDPDRTAQSGGVPTGLSGGTDQSHYVALTTYHYDAVTGQRTETRRYHDIPSSGAGTLSTDYDATIVQYDYMGRREYTIQTVSGTAPGSSGVEQVTQVVYQRSFLSRVTETKAGVSASGHDMTSDYDTYPTLRTISKAEYDEDGIGDGHLTQSLSYHGTGANDYTGINYHRDYRGRLRGAEPIYHNGSAETAIGPFTVQDVRWDGRTTHTAVYDTNPTWATVLGDDDYADTVATNRRALSEVLFDDMQRRYRSKNYTIAESDGSKGSYFRTDTFYDRNGRVVAMAPAYSVATEYAYDGLGRQYQTRSVARLEGEPASSGDTADLTTNDYDCYQGAMDADPGAFEYCTPTPDPDFSDMTGTDGYVYALTHTEYSDDSADADPATGEMGLPTRRYSVDQNGDNQAANKVGVDFTNDDDYVVTFVYTYYDDADRPTAVINHGSGESTWTTSSTSEPDYDSTDVPQFTDDGTGGSPDVEGRAALLATFAYDADTGRRNLVTRAIGTSDPLATIDIKTFHDDAGRTTYVAENHDDFDPATLTTIGDGTDDSKDRVTAVAYDGLGNVTSQTAYNGTNTDDQVTSYYYEDAVSASRVTHIVYSDSTSTPSSGSDLIEITYNTDGSVATRTDQRGVVLTFLYNDRRQLEYQDASASGGLASIGVDDAIESIGRTYDALARLQAVTSYDDVSTGSPAKVNEVEFVYNDLGQLTNSYQDHDGAADSADPTVTYTYDTSQTSSIYNDGAKMTKLDYPGAPGSGGDGVYNGRRRVTFVTLSGSGGGGDKWNPYQRLHRTYGIHEANTTTGNSGDRVLQTMYSGRGRLARLYFDKMDNDPGPNGNYVQVDMWRNNSSAGYDRFGRTAGVTYDVDGVATHAVDLNYGYDAGSNRLYREDELASSAHTVNVDELYGHDDLSRMDNFRLGNVANTSTTPSIASPDDQQDWDLDPLGNWAAFSSDLDGPGNTAYELVQARSHNDANEIDTDNNDANAAGASITASTGTNWVDPEYDPAGNMDKRPDPADPGTDTSAHLMTYDAWNRLVKITDNDTPTTIATYEYDGLGRRIEKTVGSDTWDYYHSSSWQVLEVRKNGDTDPFEQFVYDGTYIDAPFMRYVDHNTDGDYADTDEGEHYLFRDASYNIVAYAGDDGTIKERYRYTPYGKRIAMTAAFADKAGTDHDQWRGFQGLRHDDESGLIENRRRMLDPGTGRFLQRDPLGYPDGMNAYAAYHVLTGQLDPTGMAEWGLNFLTNMYEEDLRYDDHIATFTLSLKWNCDECTEEGYYDVDIREMQARAQKEDSMGGGFGKLDSVSTTVDAYPFEQDDGGKGYTIVWVGAGVETTGRVGTTASAITGGVAGALIGAAIGNLPGALIGTIGGVLAGIIVDLSVDDFGGAFAYQINIWCDSEGEGHLQYVGGSHETFGDDEIYLEGPFYSSN